MLRQRLIDLRVRVLNNELNIESESTHQDNERKRSANDTNLPTSTCYVYLLNSFSFGERLRSLISVIGFVSFVQFVVEQKYMVVFDYKPLFK